MLYSAFREILVLWPLIMGSAHSSRIVQTIPSTPSNSSSTVQFTSSHNGLDSPKVFPINSNVSDWWYFDVTSPDLRSSVVVEFFATTVDAFPLLEGQTGTIHAALTATFANGSQWGTVVSGDRAVITSEGEGASGVWEGTGFSFIGTPDLSLYTIRIDTEEVQGTIVFDSIAAAHYPCGPLRSGETMQLLPHMGWSNAVPDANAVVNLNILGTSFRISNGVGYHDQDWTDQPFLGLFSSYTWGHIHLGPYSIVFLASIALDGTENASVYVSRQGVTLAAQCQGLKVRPYGRNATYPPHNGDGDPEGFDVTIDLDNDHGSLKVRTAGISVNSVPGVFGRWHASASGYASKTGERWNDGVGMVDQFRLSA